MKYAVTENLDKALRTAREAAKKYANPEIGTEHILYGLTSVRECTASKLLVERGVDLSFSERVFGGGAHMRIVGDVDYTPRVKSMFQTGFKLSQSLGQSAVGTEHFL